MSGKSLIVPLVVAAVVYAGATILFMQSGRLPAEVPAGDAPSPATASVPPPSGESASEAAPEQESASAAEPTLAPKPAENPRPVKKLGVSRKADRIPAPTTKKTWLDKPAAENDDKSLTDTVAFLKRWKAAPLTPPQGQFYIPSVNSAAISDDGLRVLIDNNPAVDIWNTAKIRCVRAQPTQAWGMTCNVILARDASHFFVRNDADKKMEVYNENGIKIGSGPQIGFAPPHGLKRPGQDFASGDYIVGSKLPGAMGIWSFRPETAALRLVVPFKDIWDVERCVALVRQPDGDFLAYHGGGAINFRFGLQSVSQTGRITKIDGIPTKDMKVVDKMSLSPDGRYLALQGQDRLEVWDVPAHKIVLDWRQDFRAPMDGRFLGDGRLAVLSVKTTLKQIATSGRTGGYTNKTARLDVMEIPSQRVAGQLSLATFDTLIPVYAFSPSGKRMVAADSKQVVLVDVERTFPVK
jgi:hypothetical protein